MKYYEVNEQNVKILGRALQTEKGLWCVYSATGAEFVTKATKIEITLQGDSEAVSDNELNYVRYAIYVNGVRVVDDRLNEAERTVTVLDTEEATEAIVTIVKLSEAAMSTMRISRIGIEGEKIAPTPDKPMMIEVVGDSITCGYGVEDEDRDHHFSTATEDVTKAYSYGLVNMLDADYSLVSVSGWGIISGYSDDGETRRTDQMLPPYYEKLGYSDENLDGVKPQEVDWDFGRRQPDLVVINLGTNDSSYCLAHEDRRELFTSEYVRFLEKVRSYNPRAKILCALGIMGENLCPCVERAVADYIAETGDAGVEFLPLTDQLPQDGYVADWHPTTVTHWKNVKKFVAKIREMFPEWTDSRNPIRPDIDPAKPVIALSFDDGPNMTTTRQMLDLLEKYQVRASFFVIGQNLTPITANQTRRAYDMGCEIQNHSLTHPFMDRLTGEQIAAEIAETSDRIRMVTGVEPGFFRPPFIVVNETMFENIDLPFICGVGVEDWVPTVSAGERAERLLRDVHDGDIILLHDLEGNVNTVEALEAVIPEFLKRGWQFVTVSELFAIKKVTPTTSTRIVYSNALQTR